MVQVSNLDHLRFLLVFSCALVRSSLQSLTVKSFRSLYFCDQFIIFHFTCSG